MIFSFDYKNNFRFLAIILFVFILSGCVVKEMGTAVKHNITGEHLLSSEQFSKGAKSFKEEVNRNPDSVLANYYYGRFLLGDEKYKKALPYLRKAATLDPDKVEYQFWVGVTYGGLGKKSLERKSYQKALSLDENHLQSLIYLGHNQFEANEYTNALISYGRALMFWPSSPSALYNRALILTKFGRNPEALEGWLEYLSYHPSGAMARQAVAHLNSLDNFSFRNYTLLSRTVTIEKIYFEPFSAEIEPASYPSLELMGTVFSNMRKGRLQVIVYQLKNKALAKQKAKNIKKFLLNNFPELQSKQIGISWFDSPEILQTSKKKKKIYDSVNFFITK